MNSERKETSRAFSGLLPDVFLQTMLFYTVLIQGKAKIMRGRDISNFSPVVEDP